MKLNETNKINYQDGAKDIAPQSFLDHLNCRFSIRQLSGDGEYKLKQMNRIYRICSCKYKAAMSPCFRLCLQKLTEQFPETVKKRQ